MDGHDRFLAALVDATGGEVYLLNGHSGVLDAPDETLRVFIPDLHLVSEAARARFKGFIFNGFTELSRGVGLFSALLSALTTVKTALGDAVEIYQLGDLCDLWREGGIGDESDPEALLRRLQADGKVGPLLQQLDALGTKCVYGNHDQWLATVFPEYQPRPDATGWMSEHGHAFDPREQHGESFNEFMVRILKFIKDGKWGVGPFEDRAPGKLRSRTEAYRDAGAHGPNWPKLRTTGGRWVGAPVDVDEVMTTASTYLDTDWFWTPGRPRVGMEDIADHWQYLDFLSAIRSCPSQPLVGATLCVIGHTHHARLIRTDHEDGRPLVIMDCGGWVERCGPLRRNDGSVVPSALSAQVGVQCGNELRIYQLGSVVRRA